MIWITTFLLSSSPALAAPLNLAATPMYPGESGTFTVDGGDEPLAEGQAVWFMVGNEVGDGPCPAYLHGECWGITTPRFVHVAWATGDNAEWTLAAPAWPIGTGKAFQAAVDAVGGVRLSNPLGVTLEEPVPVEPVEWVFAAYFGAPTVFDPTVYYGDGDFSCIDTCAHHGLVPTGARWVCNHYDGGEGEGCGPHNHGEYSDEGFCADYIEDGVYYPLMDGCQDHGDGPEATLRKFMEGVSSESRSWHAIECQCN
jgi:hypothetical protein